MHLHSLVKQILHMIFKSLISLSIEFFRSPIFMFSSLMLFLICVNLSYNCIFFVHLFSNIFTKSLLISSFSLIKEMIFSYFEILLIKSLIGSDFGLVKLFICSSDTG